MFKQSQKPLIDIKKYIIPKNCSQCYEIKISNSGKYDEQINLTISSIKNKLFEITKEFKEFRSPPPNRHY